MTPELAAAIRVHKAKLLALPGCDSCDRWPLLLPETRTGGICLRCLPAEQYTATIRAIGNRRDIAIQIVDWGQNVTKLDTACP